MKKILLFLFILSAYPGFSQDNGDKKADTTVQFVVYGNCSMCKERIEDAAKGKGVTSAVWNMQSKIFTLRFDPALTSRDKVEQRIADAGHDTERKKAKDAAYKNLPDCCLYRDGPMDDAEHENAVMGVVVEVDEKGNFKPLAGATVLIDGASSGVTTNENGYFKIVLQKTSAAVAISYAGFQPRTIEVKAGQHLYIKMDAAGQLQEVKVVSSRKPTYIPRSSTLRTQIMTERELFKAACCNLSESFETNPSVDVSFNDAVTGSKQIQLLGLSGNYSQLTVENLPGPRGIATPWGLNSVPGTWIESIQLTKGVGSVVNGFESIAGQINVELRKPENSDQLYANVYVNDMGKTDLNLNLSRKLGKKWSTALLLHDAFLNNNKVDFNKDGFRDLPTGNLFTLMNRWKYENTSGWQGQAGFRVLIDNKIGGQTSFDPDKHKFTTDFYGLGIETNRYEAFVKIGYVFPEKKFKSFGLQLSGFSHEQNSYFGFNKYEATQKNLYANFIYQSIISNSNHKFRTGASIISDNYDELAGNYLFDRKEIVPGAFFEYNYSKGENFSLVAGIRGDHNSLFGFFLTPRLHVRYEPVSGTCFRITAGRGQRTANIFAENTGIFVSSRQYHILNASSGKAYGLDPEVAWNEGIMLDQQFRLWNRSGMLSLNFFRTDFQKQVVVDWDKTARQVHFYNLTGRSRSNSFQAEVNYELLRRLELRLAYRLFDVKTTYETGLLQKPLISKHRGFANLGYEINKWKFDYTITINGKKRIPFTGDNPAQHRLAETSPAYVVMNAQVSKTLGNKFPVDIYLGGENISNYYQERVILSPDQPFGPYFDASLIWGPVSGRMIYGGVRFKIK